jgi:hypothetical protein
MASLGTMNFKGESGSAYPFKVYALGTKLRKLSGMYVVTRRRRDANGRYRHRALYVGQTGDFSQPFERHRKAADLRKRGANCICLLGDDSQESRLAKQRDLVAAYHPVCNH